MDRGTYLEFHPMRRAILLMLPLALCLAGCLKDDLDLADRTSNPLDPDYDGPALIELVSDTARIVYAGGMPTDTVVEQHVHVRTDLLPPGTDYALYVTLENTGEIFDYSGTGIVPTERPYHHVVPGVSYCYDYQLKVQFSLTRAYTYCTTANP